MPEDELIRRVKALAAAEAAAAAAAAAAASPAGKGAAPKGSKPVSAGKSSAGGGGNGSSAGDKGGAGLPASHNNEKDWARRMEAYKQLMQEDAADLAANVSAQLSESLYLLMLSHALVAFKVDRTGTVSICSACSRSIAWDFISSRQGLPLLRMIYKHMSADNRNSATPEPAFMCCHMMHP